MNDEADDLAGSLRVLAGEARRRQGPAAHPSLERLTAFHAGELDPAAEDEVQDHLAVCRHCTGLLLDLPAFLETPAGAAGATGDEGDDGGEPDAEWQAIRGRLPGPLGPSGHPEQGGRRREPAPAHPPAWTPAAPRPRRRRLLWLAAAALAVLTVPPLWFIAWRLAAPTLPPATVDLFPAEVWRGPTETPPPSAPATVHAAATSTTLILRLARDQPNLRFGLELRGAGPSAAESGAPVALPVTRVIDPHTLLLVLARHQLAPGRYRLRVLDAERPSARPLGDYALEVVEP
jgi:hypothetical protein